MNYDKISCDIYTDSCNLNNQGRFAEGIYVSEAYAVQSLNVLGLNYCQSKKYDESIRCFKDALKIDPGNWILWSNITHVESTRENYDEALKASEKTLLYARNCHFDAFYNAGVIYTALNMMKDAENMYRHALQLSPENPHSNYNLALALLRQNICMEGWEKYEYRYQIAPYIAKFKERFTQPTWDGKPFKNKTLLVFSEQGLGDFIFFARFLPEVKKMGGTVLVEVQEPVAPLVDSKLAHAVIGRAHNTLLEKAPDADMCVSICSIPLILGIDNLKKIPNKPYIKIPKSEKPEQLTKEKFNVGICWAGNPDHSRDHTRSMHLHQFKPIFDLKNIQTYSLMKNVTMVRNWPEGKVILDKGIENMPICDLAPYIDNFSDLARFINHLDLVITIDSSVAHLCGAMGKPVWTIIGRETDWRWGDNTDSSHWYPSMKLFRYKTDWKTTMQEVAQRLQDLIT